MQKLTMKQLPKEDRPYEKCLESGAASLTDAELLAVIIRTGSREETSLELGQTDPVFGRAGKPAAGAFASFPGRLLPHQRRGKGKRCPAYVHR